MKKKIYVLSLSVLLACSACEDWLTIQPETTVAAETLFKTDVGITQGLNGAYYTAMSIYAPSNYLGGSSFIEYMANTYYCDPEMKGDDYYFSIHTYEQSDSQNNVNEWCFTGLYKVIANLNSMLSEMAKNVEKLTPNIYKICRGEAYALRACCHLDILRLYGPVPSAADASKTYVPYVRVNDVEDYTYHTFNQFMDYVQADLDSAEMFLQTVEPVLTQTFEATNSTSNTWPYRKSRCNYYAVLALQARAALWRGDKEKALHYAKLVKEAKNEDGTPKVRLTTPNDNMSDYTVTDKTHYSEHLFGIKSETYDVNSYSNPFSKKVCYNKEDFIIDLYGEDYKNDLRYKNWWNISGKWEWIGDWETGHSVWVTDGKYYITKYNDFTTNNTSAPHNFPIIRLPEMYFIIMECGTLTEANVIYEEYCNARGITYKPLTEDDRQERVILESIREYVAEGQNFFTYKRNNVKNMYGAIATSSEDQYIMPLPEAEYADVK